MFCRLRSVYRGQATGRLLFLIGALLLAACGDDPADDGPYVEFAGGGFIFNYRLATADYGFVIRMLRQPPSGTVLEARFEDPAGGPPIVVTSVHRWGRLDYSFRTPPVQGVKAGRDYAVELRLLVPAAGPDKPAVLASYAKSFHADVDQTILPKEALAPGPGYQKKAPDSQ